MRSLIFLVIFMFTILSFVVQARPLENIDRNLEIERKDVIEFPNYLNLLPFLQNRRTNRLQNTADDNQNINKMMPRIKDQLTSENRRFLSVDTRGSNRNGRPSNTYGRKSHWDAFFG